MTTTTKTATKTRRTAKQNDATVTEYLASREVFGTRSARTVGAIAAATGLTLRQAGNAVDRLEDAGKLVASAHNGAEAWCYTLTTVERKTETAEQADDYIDDLDIVTENEVTVLRSLMRVDGVTGACLEESTGLPTSAVDVALNGLRLHGFAARTCCPDHDETVFVLTEAGADYGYALDAEPTVQERASASASATVNRPLLQGTTADDLYNCVCDDVAGYASAVLNYDVTVLARYVDSALDALGNDPETVANAVAWLIAIR